MSLDETQFQRLETISNVLKERQLVLPYGVLNRTVERDYMRDVAPFTTKGGNVVVDAPADFPVALAYEMPEWAKTFMAQMTFIAEHSEHDRQVRTPEQIMDLMVAEAASSFEHRRLGKQVKQRIVDYAEAEMVKKARSLGEAGALLCRIFGGYNTALSYTPYDLKRGLGAFDRSLRVVAHLLWTLDTLDAYRKMEAEAARSGGTAKMTNHKSMQEFMEPAIDLLHDMGLPREMSSDYEKLRDLRKFTRRSAVAPMVHHYAEAFDEIAEVAGKPRFSLKKLEECMLDFSAGQSAANRWQAHNVAVSLCYTPFSLCWTMRQTDDEFKHADLEKFSRKLLASLARKFKSRA